MSRMILVPLDGSPFAEHALPAALAIARRTGAVLELVIVDRAPVPWISPELLVAFDQNHVGVDGMLYLEELHARMPADVPVRLTRLFGTPTPLLVRRVLKTEPALVIMSTHGRGGFSRVWLGSVADGVARQSPTPVLLVKPPLSVPNFAAPFRAARVLIPLDGTVASEEILDQALAVFGVVGVEYTLLRVISPLAAPNVHYPTVTSTRRAEMDPDALLHAEAERIRDLGAVVTEKLVVRDSPATAIVTVADEIEASVIAMTTHARRGVSRFVMGSVADKVLRTAPCPVMLFQPTHEVVDVRRRVEAAIEATVPL